MLRRVRSEQFTACSEEHEEVHPVAGSLGVHANQRLNVNHLVVVCLWVVVVADNPLVATFVESMAGKELDRKNSVFAFGLCDQVLEVGQVVASRWLDSGRLELLQVLASCFIVDEGVAVGFVGKLNDRKEVFRDPAGILEPFLVLFVVIRIFVHWFVDNLGLGFKDIELEIPASAVLGEPPLAIELGHSVEQAAAGVFLLESKVALAPPVDNGRLVLVLLQAGKRAIFVQINVN